MIRVIQIMSGWGSGGVEKYVSNCASILNEDVTIDVLAVRGISSNPLFSKKIELNGGKIYSVEKRKNENYFQRNRRRQQYIKEHLKKEKYDIVHINGTTADFMQYAKIAKKISPNSKVIMHCHGDNVDEPNGKIKKIVHFINRQLYSSKVDYCLGCSTRTMNWMYTPKALKNKKNSVINCGIDTDFFRFDENKRTKIRKELNIYNKFIVGTVGRICNQKNPEFILKIIDELKKQCPEIIFLWIGSGDKESEIYNKAKEMDLLENIIFCGTISNVNDMLSAMDVFILPSNYEGNPIVGFESQVNGLKCFFSDTIVEESKITEMVEFLSINNSEKIWAKKILEYREEYTISKRKKLKIKNGYDFKDCAYMLKNIYDDIIDKK